MVPDSASQNSSETAPETVVSPSVETSSAPHLNTDIRSDVPAPVEGQNPEIAVSTWEDDETTFTSGSRAAVTLLAGCMLVYAQWNSNLNPATFEGWNRWVGNSVVCNFLLPLGIVWFFFGQNLTFQSWLKDQRHNAWTYGWDFARWKEGKTKKGKDYEFVVWDLKSKKKDLLLGLAMGAALLPFLFFFSMKPDVRAVSATFMPVPQSAVDWAVLIGGLIVYMFCWEWFFRGFLLFGVAQGFGWIPAVLIQAVVFGLAHTGKSPPEVISSYAGGLILGVICWQRKTFLPAFVAHALVHVSWALLVLR